MAKEYIEKIQGDGRMSWTCTETDDDGNLINAYMVYEDPYAEEPKTNLIEALKSATPEEIAYLKQLLNG